jgi:hypothetical protein
MSETVQATPNVGAIVEKYLALRDRKAELKAAYDASVKDIEAAMERVENYLLRIMQEQGLESVRTPFGTPYISRRTSATVADWESFLDFVKANDEWSMLKRDVSKAVVEQYRNEHNDLPPGLNWREERVVNIKRSS